MNSFKQISNDLVRIADKNIFFLVGVAKSGTTWLQHILDGHPEISCKGESHLVGHLMPELMNLLAQHNDIIRRKNKMLQQENDGYPTFANADVLFLAKTALLLLLKSQTGDKTVKIIGEKTPDNILHLDQISEHLIPSAKFIHIIRDGRDGAVSGWHHIHADTPEWANENFPTFLNYVDVYADRWQLKINHARQFGINHPESYLEVRYELLQSQTHDEIKRVLDFLIADASDENIRCCIDAGKFEKLSQGRHRGEEDPNSHFRKGVVGDWQTLFDSDCIQQFESRAGKLLGELGYRW